ncbi:MAG: alpha/beta fold hydrolase [Minwuia sp.]|uniref:alpha/beta fold hydrolase n=1 Tax=Minwuia sp. TaxID=2493630 RepID=UPI003A84FE87
MTGERITQKTHDGLTLVGEAFGPAGGPPVLFMHGGGQTRHSWGGTARTMAARGWRALIVDHRGHGDSGWSAEGNYSYEAAADDARGWADLLGGSPVFIGASLGGITGMLATGEEPRLRARALVLVDIAPKIEAAGSERILDFMRRNMEDGFATLEDAAAEVAAYTPERKRKVDLNSIRKNLRERDGRWYWHWDPKTITHRSGRDSAIMGPKLDEAVRNADCPILLVRGRFSDVVSPEGADHLKALRPDAGFVDVGGAGHMVAGDRNDVFTDAVIGFLEERGIMQQKSA